MTSEQEVAVYNALRRGEWVTAKQVTALARVAGRTVRHHLHRFVALGIAEEAVTDLQAKRYRLMARSERLDVASSVIRQEARAEPMTIQDAWARR